MARKKSGYAEAERRYLAMRAREAAGPKRTLGDMMNMRLRVREDIADSVDAMTRSLDKVYGDATGPVKSDILGQSKYRTLAYPCDGYEGPRLAVISFGWSSDHGHLPEYRYLRSWSKDFYRGYDDPDLMRRLLRREIRGEIDALSAAFEIATLFENNDEDLVREFDRQSHRNAQLFYRLRVVEMAIEKTVTGLLEKKIHWRLRQGQDWTRVRLDDGSYLTVTDTGSVMFGDRVKDADLSLSDLPTKKPYGPSLALLDRQRRALERK